jgi:hypothetical protein
VEYGKALSARRAKVFCWFSYGDFPIMEEEKKGTQITLGKIPWNLRLGISSTDAAPPMAGLSTLYPGVVEVIFP